MGKSQIRRHYRIYLECILQFDMSYQNLYKRVHFNSKDSNPPDDHYIHVHTYGKTYENCQCLTHTTVTHISQNVRNHDRQRVFIAMNMCPC